MDFRIIVSKIFSDNFKMCIRDRLEYDGIVHTRASHGTGGGKHRFSYASPKFEELDQQQLTPFDLSLIHI